MVYKNIQGLRAIAALMVVIAHVFWPLEPLRAHWIVPYVDSVGPAGVDLFFVISGFVVYLSADRLGKKTTSNGRFSSFREFSIKRIFRIYPVYWIAFGVATLLMTKVELAPEWMAQKPWWKLMLLIDQPNNRIQAAWTLQFEMYFYAICALAILLFPRKILLILGAWLATVLAAWLAAYWGYTATFSIWMTPMVLEFAFGIVVARLAMRSYSEFAVSSLAIGFCGLLLGAVIFRKGGGWWDLPAMWRVLCFGLPSGFIVYGFMAVEQRKMWTFSPAWIALGDSSYSLYLWHQLLFAVMASWYTSSGIVNHVPLEILALSFVAIAIVVGFASYHYIENFFNKQAFVHRLAKGRIKTPITVTRTT